ncbi:MAG: PAS domain-containing protein [Proteobacteria bacterium]|nr:PAS domain-containing protein [Pseudomonadota bacterium]MBS0549301.1 PAS domain-containing protein [Pseudomonadota bacterium]
MPVTSEASRLAALLSYDVLDTPPEEHFDDIVQLARAICRTPVALVSLVAADRQWFKARAGVELCETPISQSVCAHAIREPEMLIVPDLTLDPRTRENTLVTGEPHIRFYAGAVLRAPSGEALGALCVIDTVPRPQGLTPMQRESLLALGRQTMALLQFRRALRAREDRMIRSDDRALAAEYAQQAGGIGTFEVDLSNDGFSASPEYRRIFGFPAEGTITTADVERLIVMSDRGSVPDARQRAAGTADRQVEYRIRRLGDGELRWISRRAEFVRDAAGKPTKFLGVVEDITERKRSEAEQQTLNDELSHRMKNTLAMVDAIAGQTLRNVVDREAVRTFSGRVQALGSAHDILLRQSMKNASVRATVRAVVAPIADPSRFVLIGPEIDLNARSVLSFSLLTHELATNAAKYGALSRDGGRVTIEWRIETLEGVPELIFDWREEGGPPVAAPTRQGFGSRLIQAGFSGVGKADVQYRPEGLHASFRVPWKFVAG